MKEKNCCNKVGSVFDWNLTRAHFNDIRYECITRVFFPVFIVYFSFLHQSFQHVSIENQGQLSSNHYVFLYLLFRLVPCFLVWLFYRFAIVTLVLISGDFRKPLPVFLILFKKIESPNKCPFYGIRLSHIFEIPSISNWKT